MLLALRRHVVFLVALGAAACQAVLGIETKEYVLPDSGAPPEKEEGGPPDDGAVPQGDAAVGDAGVDVRTSCPIDVKGAQLVAIPSPHGGVMCIDPTETTQHQYGVFVTAVNSGASFVQPPTCAWNQTVAPDPSCLDGGASPCSGQDCDSFPQICVDWCDAYAYCVWAGKKLCGDFDGGPTPYHDTTSALTSMWTNACTSGGKHAYPYGDGYVPSACRTNTTSPVGVTTYTDCQSKEPDFRNVYDLSGNVQEWVDSCNGNSGPDDICMLRGGDYTFDADFVKCATERFDNDKRNAVSLSRGFRCCVP